VAATIPVTTDKFGDTLTGLMRLHGFSASKLAAMVTERGLPTPESTIHTWKRGYFPGHWAKVLPILAEIFGVPASVFIEGQDPTVDPDSLKTVPKYNTFAEAITNELARRGTSQTWVAEQISKVGIPITRQTVSKWTKGSTPRSGQVMLPLLAELLGVKVETLIPRSVAPEYFESSTTSESDQPDEV